MPDAAILGLTIDAFFNWCPTDEHRRWELFDGRPVAMAPTSRVHATLLGNITRAGRAAAAQ